MSDAPRELFLIDGNSLAYRAFYALPETIATSKGFPTNAIFGFASMLVKILTEYGPKATLVVWDAGMSGRGEISEDYKAGRKPRPDLLKEQWPHLQPLVEAFGYQNVRIERYEADDVIATLAMRAREQGIDVMVVTGDRDMFQLTAHEGIRVMATSRGITDTKIYDSEAVTDRYGIGPQLIPDFVGLKGDTSDNIPGVPGIGDKTASQLLQEWGDLEGVLANIDSISGAKRKENLTARACARRSASSSCARPWSASRRPSARATRQRRRSAWTRSPRCRHARCRWRRSARSKASWSRSPRCAPARTWTRSRRLLSTPRRSSSWPRTPPWRQWRRRFPRSRRRSGRARSTLTAGRADRSRSPPGRATTSWWQRPRRWRRLRWHAASTRWWRTTGRRSRWPTTLARPRR